LRDRLEDFKKRNASVVAIAPDTIDHARAYFDKNQLPFTCLADPGRTVFSQYDVKSALASLGQRPGLFIVDKDGIARFAYLGWQQWEIPTIDETLAQLDALS
jgi:peroxiredoxin